MGGKEVESKERDYRQLFQEVLLLRGTEKNEEVDRGRCIVKKLWFCFILI